MSESSRQHGQPWEAQSVSSADGDDAREPRFMRQEIWNEARFNEMQPRGKELEGPLRPRTEDPAKHGFSANCDLLVRLAEAKGAGGQSLPEPMNKDEFSRHAKALGDDDFDVREHAQESLSKLTARQLLDLNRETVSKNNPDGVLISALQGADLEARRRAQNVIAGIADKHLDQHSVEKWTVLVRENPVPMPRVLATDMTVAQGQKESATMLELAKVMRASGLEHGAVSLEQQAKPWSELDKTRHAVSELRLSRNEAPSQAEIDQLRKLPGLKALELSGEVETMMERMTDFKTVTYLKIGGRATDSAFQHLTNFPSVSHLYICSSVKIDKGLEHLKGLKNLESLMLGGIGGPELGNSRAEMIKDLPNLKHLNVARMCVGDNEFATLAKMKSLVSLEIDVARITDAATKHLKELPRLEALTLGKSLISDKSIDNISGLTHLRWLRLSSPELTDRALEKIAAGGFPKLESFVGYNPQISEAAMERLRDHWQKSRNKVLHPDEWDANRTYPYWLR